MNMKLVFYGEDTGYESFAKIFEVLLDIWASLWILISLKVERFLLLHEGVVGAESHLALKSLLLNNKGTI